MAGEWKRVKIGEVAERVAMGPFGSSIKVSTFVEKGIPVISGQHLRGSRLEDNEFNFVSEEHADSLKNANVFQGDVVFTHAGNIGQCAYIPESSKYRRYVLSQRQFYMRCDKSKVLPEFITCFFKSAEGRHALLANASQTGVPSIARPVTYVRTIEIPLPPLAEQKAIAAVLGALDDKIELNRRMNATLEAMARALFQSWFVDFDPVRAKLDGRKPAGLDEATAALFPEHFQDSEVGHIPHGWTVGVLDELTSFVIGGDWGATEPTSDETVSCFCIRGADIPSLQSGGVGKMPTRFLKPSSVEKRQLADGDLAIEISGGSPTQCTGRPVLVSEALLQNLGQPLVASNFCRVVKLKSPAFSKFVYLWLRWLYDAGELFQFETGTTGIKNFAFVIFSEKYPVVVPDLRVAEAFDRAVAPLFARIQANSHQSRTLATLRDTLLPKLLSGELSVAKLQH